MKFIIRFMQDDKFMLVCNADRTPMTFTTREAATEMAWAFEEKYKGIHWVEERLF
jgi:hypothetical protein